MLTLRGAFRTQPMDGVYWSLVVEIRFYVLVAIALILNKIHRAQPLLIFWLVATIVIDVFPAIKMRSFLVADDSSYFIAGATCFLIWSQGLSLARIGLHIASWSLALLQSLDILPDFEGYYNTSMNRYAVAAIVTAFFLVMLLVSLCRTIFLRRCRWLLLGALTYPLYLIHQNVGYMIFNLAYSMIDSRLLLWIVIFIVFCISFIVHVCVERRFAEPLKNVLKRAFDVLALHTICFDWHTRTSK